MTRPTTLGARGPRDPAQRAGHAVVEGGCCAVAEDLPKPEARTKPQVPY